MGEQQELSLMAVNNSLEAIQGKPVKVGKQILRLMDQQTPMVWCGGVDGDCHDVTICLVPNRIKRNTSEETEHHGEILTVLKVHSSRLRRCSTYFETCLAERWSRSCSTFILETDTDVAYYTDCFSRMYKPTFHKDFKDIKYSLELLKVASQIQFHELMDFTLLYISSKLWSDADEVMIRLYSASPGFPRAHAQDLVVRLGMVDESKEACHKQLCDVVKQCTRAALGYDGNFRSSRALIKELLPDSALNNGMGSGPSADSNVTRDVLMIVSRETKDMLVRVGNECDGQTYLSVPKFAEKILAICWILEALLAAKVAEEVVQCFVHLHALPKILAIDSLPAMTGRESFSQYQERTKLQRGARDAAAELVKLVLLMYREAAAGNLLLKTPERVILLRSWHSVLEKFSSKDSPDQAAKDLYSTLPFKQQMALVKSLFKDGNYEDFINTNCLAMLLRGKWPAMEVKYDVVSSPSTSQLGVAIASDFENLKFHPSEL